MARINIEEKWWSDPRRLKLGQLLGNHYFTETVVVHAWRLAQEHWEKGELVPGYIFITLFGAYELLKSNLASLHETIQFKSNPIRTPIEHISNTTEQGSNIVQTHLSIIEHSYVYVRGSEEWLSWGVKERQKRVEAGRKSAQKRRLLYGNAQPISNTSRTAFEQDRTLSNSPAPVPVPIPAPAPKKKKYNNVGIRLDYPKEFDELWQAYGRVGDKKAAYDQYGKLSLTSEEKENLKIALSNYVRSTPDPKYRQHLVRFLKSDWRECLKSIVQGNRINWDKVWGEEEHEQDTL